ncbi:uncharacterized protein LOC135431862 [Drosophila montana]|uniref:uncharacterized protein LOC135431862 n=1 Tax=Drosophila montana TaxID=40370 RepID=UPI00313A9A32
MVIYYSKSSEKFSPTLTVKHKHYQEVLLDMKEMRRACRPQPSLISRLNCKTCNRVLFFIAGVGSGVFYIRHQEQIAEELRNAEQGNNKKDKGNYFTPNELNDDLIQLKIVQIVTRM